MNTPLRPTELLRYQRGACESIRKAGALMKRTWGKVQASQISSKARNDFVTVIDKKSQEILVAGLSRKFRHTGFIAEENGMNRQKEWTWIIDPLDGTMNFMYGLPAFCVSVGLRHQATGLSVGIVYDPIHEEWFTAVRGGGSFLNRRRIRVSTDARLANALLATGFPYRIRSRFEPYHRSFRSFFFKCRGIRRLGSAALDLCYTACGRFDGYWEMGLHIWDSAAGSLIVREAGGVVTDFEGGDGYLESGDTLAGNPALHRAMLRIVKPILT